MLTRLFPLVALIASTLLFLLAFIIMPRAAETPLAWGSAGLLTLPVILGVATIEAPRKSFGWKTILGGIVWAFGYVSAPDTLALLPPKVAAIVTALGALLAVFGLRAAQAKTQQTAALAAEASLAAAAEAAAGKVPASRSMGGS